MGFSLLYNHVISMFFDSADRSVQGCLELALLGIDILFQKDFSNSNISFDKFNIVSILEEPDYICDNFYLFPYKYLIPFSGIIKKDYHMIKDEIEKSGCPINYILNERGDNDLLFYKNVTTPYI